MKKRHDEVPYCRRRNLARSELPHKTCQMTRRTATRQAEALGYIYEARLRGLNACAISLARTF